jgi:hypothetical protein
MIDPRRRRADDALDRSRVARIVNLGRAMARHGERQRGSRGGDVEATDTHARQRLQWADRFPP